jgi:hypothetical protein
VLARAPQALDQVRGYLQDGGPFPQRLHIIALFAAFHLELYELLVRWSDLAEAEIEGWPGTAGVGGTAPTRALLEALHSRLQALDARAAATEAAPER